MEVAVGCGEVAWVDGNEEERDTDKETTDDCQE